MAKNYVKEIVHFNWDQYYKLIYELAVKIHLSGWRPDLIFGILRGGGFVLDALSRLFKKEINKRLVDCPTAYVLLKRYENKLDGTGVASEEVYFPRVVLSNAKPGKYERVLVVDDLDEWGVTLERTVQAVQSGELGYTAKEVRSGCLIHKETSRFQPDYYAIRMRINPRDPDGECDWVEQPFEKAGRRLLQKLVEERKEMPGGTFVGFSKKISDLIEIA